MQKQLVVLTSAHKSLFYLQNGLPAYTEQTNLTPWRIPPWNATNSSGSQQIPAGYGNGTFNVRLHKHPTSPPYPEPYQSIILTIHFNIILSSTPVFQVVSFLQFSYQPLLPILSHTNPRHALPSYSRSILILSYHVRLCLSSGLFTSVLIPISPPYLAPYQSTPRLTIICTIHFNIIVSCTPMYFKWSLFFRFHTENFNALLIAPKREASRTTWHISQVFPVRPHA
jgi:hypothetical protein